MLTAGLWLHHKDVAKCSSKERQKENFQSHVKKREEIFFYQQWRMILRNTSAKCPVSRKECASENVLKLISE